MSAQTAVNRLGNLGYAALIKEATIGTPLTPNVFVPIYKCTLGTDPKFDKDNPIMGVRSEVFAIYQGLRDHMGTIEALAEANTAEYWFDMFLAAGSITGGGDPYTHPFTEGLSNSYTLDVLRGQVVERFWGVMAEDLEFSIDKNKMKFMLNVSARGSFQARQIATVSTTTITLDTSYDQVPNKGLVASDVVRILKADNSNFLDTTVSSVNVDGITVVLGNSAAAFASGDVIFLRAQTPSYTLQAIPFEWSRTEFRFGANASAALTAAHLPQETSAKWKLTHKFENKEGAHRSGSPDPAELVRLQTGAEITLKTFFDQPTLNLMKWLNITPDALVVRHFAGSNHELRMTFDQGHYETHKRELDSGKIIYGDIKMTPVYNQSNGEAYNVKVINSLAS